jgi:hypothetical protein
MSQGQFQAVVLLILCLFHVFCILPSCVGITVYVKTEVLYDDLRRDEDRRETLLPSLC